MRSLVVDHKLHVIEEAFSVRCVAEANTPACAKVSCEARPTLSASNLKVSTFIGVCVCVCVCVCVFAYACVSKCSFIFYMVIFVCKCMCMFVCMYVCMYVHGGGITRLEVDIKVERRHRVVCVAVAVIRILAVGCARRNISPFHPPPGVPALCLDTVVRRTRRVEVPTRRITSRRLGWEPGADACLLGAIAVPASMEGAGSVQAPVILPKRQIAVSLTCRADSRHWRGRLIARPVAREKLGNDVEVLADKVCTLAEERITAVPHKRHCTLAISIVKHPVVLVVEGHVASPSACFPFPHTFPRLVALEHGLHFRSAWVLPEKTNAKNDIIREREGERKESSHGSMAGCI